MLQRWLKSWDNAIKIVIFRAKFICYGTATLFNLAADLQDLQIVYALRKLFSWTHFRIFIRIEDDLKRRFYMEMCRIEKWGTRQLEERIDSMLYERTAISRKPDELIQLELHQVEQANAISEDFVFRDPYLLDFLDLKDTYSEKDLETASVVITE